MHRPRHVSELVRIALEVEDGRIVGIYIVRNPDKLGHVAGTMH